MPNKNIKSIRRFGRGRRANKTVVRKCLKCDVEFKIDPEIENFRLCKFCRLENANIEHSYYAYISPYHKHWIGD